MLDLAAGLLGWTDATKAPSVESNPKLSENSGVRSCICTPSHPLFASPKDIICSTISLAVFEGIENPSPTLPPV